MSIVGVYLTRHGETSWNLEQRLQGVSDIPLTPRGERQAELLARRLDGTSIAAVFSSDLQRATRTAEIINETINAPFFPVPELRERNWGCLEGLTWSDIESRYPDYAGKIRSGDMDFAPDGGESKNQAV
ncbi:MAG: histidine phosphatase family protein, partial [bacterium]